MVKLKTCNCNKRGGECGEGEKNEDLMKVIKKIEESGKPFFISELSHLSSDLPCWMEKLCLQEEKKCRCKKGKRCEIEQYKGKKILNLKKDFFSSSNDL